MIIYLKKDDQKLMRILFILVFTFILTLLIGKCTFETRSSTEKNLESNNKKEIVKLESSLDALERNEQWNDLLNNTQKILSYYESHGSSANAEKVYDMYQKAKDNLKAHEIKEKNWIAHSRTSKMDDSAGYFAQIKAKNPVNVWLDTVTPNLVIRCFENKTDVVFEVFSNFNTELGQYQKAKIRYRFDSEEAKTEYWSESTDGDAVFAIMPIKFLKKMINHKKLAVQFIPFNADPVIAEFNIVGSRSHVERIADKCNWAI